MRVVSYARVSTLRQESSGESLPNQERAFHRWLERTQSERVAAYQDTASGGSIEGRAEFRHMIAELRHTKPEAIIVDTLDRFTRNLRDGLNTLEELRGHGVALLPLDWGRNRPLDLDDDRDWADVVDEFTGAEQERRRIRRRVRRAYQGRRERGATFTNRLAFGLVRVGDHMAPDPATAWIVRELDRRALAGESMRDLCAWARAIHPDAWTTMPGIAKALRNRSYVMGGLRTADEQQRLDAIEDLRRGRFGAQRLHDHEFSGVFLCGICFDAGIINRMSAAMTKGTKPQLVCDRRPHGKFKGRMTAHPERYFCVSVDRISDTWQSLVEHLEEPGILDRWAAMEGDERADRHRSLERRLAQIDQQSAALKARRDAAFDALVDTHEPVRKQARKMLSEVERDESALATSRAVVLGELANEPMRERDANAMRQALAAYHQTYEGADLATRNRLNRALCAAIGSHPRVYREGHPKSKWSNVRVLWPEIETLRVAVFPG